MELAPALLHVATDQLTHFEGPNGSATTAYDAIRIVREHNPPTVTTYQLEATSEHADAYQTVLAATDETIDKALADYGLYLFCRRAAQAAAVRIALDLENDESDDPGTERIARFDQNIERLAHVLEHTDNFSAYEALQVAKGNVQDSIAAARELIDDTTSTPEDTDMDDQHTGLDRVALYRLWTGEADNTEYRYRDASIVEHNRAQQRIKAWRDGASKIHTTSDIADYLAGQIDKADSIAGSHVYSSMLNDVHEISSGNATVTTVTSSAQQPRPIWEIEVMQAARRWGMAADLPYLIGRLAMAADADLDIDPDERITAVAAIEAALKESAAQLVGRPIIESRLISEAEIFRDFKIIEQLEQIADLAGQVQSIAAAVAADMKATYNEPETDEQEGDDGR